MALTRNDRRVPNSGQPCSSTLTLGLDRFEPFSLAQGAAALALWPPNADRHVALNSLVDALAERPMSSQTGVEIEARHWRRWLASRLSGSFRAIQPAGTHDAPLTIEAALLGKRRALLGGDLEYPDVYYCVWTQAIAGVLAEGPDRALEDALDLLLAAARLSDHVSRAAILGAYRWPYHGLPLKLRAPDDAEFDCLREALTITAGQLDALGLKRSALERLVRSAGESSRWRPLMWGPDDQLLVADPWRLTVSALVRSSAVVAESSRLPAVLGRLTQGALALVLEAAEDMDWQVSSSTT